MPLEALHEQNINLYVSVARCLAAGDVGQLQHIGLSERQIAYLLQLSLSKLLGLADDGLDLHSHLRVATRYYNDEALCSALIERRAPRELMTQLFGMNTRRYTTERARLGVAGKRGRPHTQALDASIEHQIWRLWILLANPQDPSQLRRADHWLLIGLEIPQHLRSAWSLIQRWAREADSRIAFAGDRARLSLAQQQAGEQKLRDKHGLLPAQAASPASPVKRPVHSSPARMATMEC
jgi:hypothetical protein